MEQLGYVLAFFAVIVPCLWFAKIWLPNWDARRKCIPRCKPATLHRINHHGAYRCSHCGWLHRPNSSRKTVWQLLRVVAVLMFLSGCEADGPYKYQLRSDYARILEKTGAELDKRYEEIGPYGTLKKEDRESHIREYYHLHGYLEGLQDAVHKP
jgi:hypothetical protein